MVWFRHFLSNWAAAARTGPGLGQCVVSLLVSTEGVKVTLALTLATDQPTTTRPPGKKGVTGRSYSLMIDIKHASFHHYAPIYALESGKAPWCERTFDSNYNIAGSTFIKSRFITKPGLWGLEDRDEQCHALFQQSAVQIIRCIKTGVLRVHLV